MTGTRLVPLATYRVQLSKDFTLDDAAGVADYLQALNISHIYLSPVMEAVPGSNHGYDVLDFSEISAERGGYDGLLRLCRKVSLMNPPLSLLLDIVPNHMAARPDNPYWHDVLVHGRASPCWKIFDLKPESHEKIDLPILGSGRDEAIAKGDIRLTTGDEGLSVIKYFDLTLPLNGEPQSGNVGEVLALQYYDLVPWTESRNHLSYRRFFDITSLVGVRVEDKDVYNKTHAALFALLKDFPCIDGIRVDHIDGLFEPEAYLRRLSHDTQRRVWVEKILAPDEEILPGWPVEGTTGYEFIDRVNRLLVHPVNFTRIRDYWVRNIEPEWEDFDTCVAASKTEVLQTLFSAELKRLVNLSCSEEKDRPQAELFWTGLIVGLDVYRVYGKDDDLRIMRAVMRAREVFGSSFAAAADKFMPVLLSPRTAREKKAAREWQQLSGPVMAKGLEDTAHYRYTPLAALNDVGCAAEIQPGDPAEFFAWLNHRAQLWPAAMNATSTHDTKRAEDVRHRLYALADRPEEWISFYEQAARLAAPFKTVSPATEYFLYQAILGTWPLDDRIDDSYIDRISNYMIKACREAKRETNWLNPSEDYEVAMARFIHQLLDDENFRSLVRGITTWLSPAGAINSLSVQTLKILSPGVPDFYQGTETWDFSLVDPDNRRPVDFGHRDKLLSDMQELERRKGRQALLRRLAETWHDGGIKLWLTRILLQIRRDHVLPLSGPLTMAPLTTGGRHAVNLLAWFLAGNSGREGLIVLCPRFPGTLLHSLPNSLRFVDWGDTNIRMDPAISGGTLYNLITDEDLPFAAVIPATNMISDFPVSVISFRA